MRVLLLLLLILLSSLINIYYILYPPSTLTGKADGPSWKVSRVATVSS
jgi:hypothetical protein